MDNDHTTPLTPIPEGSSREGERRVRTVLFVCTGNYYRSRFAEGLFNHEAARSGVGWRAVSRGLAIHLVEGDLSVHTEAAFRERGIARGHTSPGRTQISEQDLRDADRIVALCEREHRPLMRAQFPSWETRVDYWTVDDIDFATPGVALRQIEERVRRLALDLQGDAAASGG